MLGQRRRRCANIKPALVQRLVSAGQTSHWQHGFNTHLFLLHVEVVNDDTNEQIESEKWSEDDEQHKIQVHEHSNLRYRLQPFL